MKVLVTGGAGFIGSHIVDGYLVEGHNVVVIDNLSSGKKENIHKKTKFYCLDITDKAKLKNIFEAEHFDIVNHHAAQIDVRKSVSDPLFDAHTNIIGLLNLLQNSVAHRVKRFIFASSGGVIYGDDAVLPIQEHAKKNPLSPYGISKLTSEYYLNFYHTVYGLSFTILRYSNVYGPRQNPHGEAGVISIFSRLMLQGKKPTIFGDGAQTRDYVYVKDIVYANLLALEKGDNEAFNIGTGKETNVNELFEIIKRIVGYKGKVKYEKARAGELLRNCLDITKANKKLGWKPRHSLEQGLKETIDWMRKL